jgi:hypothetical protein
MPVGTKLNVFPLLTLRRLQRPENAESSLFEQVFAGRWRFVWQTERRIRVPHAADRGLALAHPRETTLNQGDMD